MKRKKEIRIHRENEVARLRLEGYTIREIAARLNVGRMTVQRIVEKLRAEWRKDCRNTFEEFQFLAMKRAEMIMAETLARWREKGDLKALERYQAMFNQACKITGLHKQPFEPGPRPFSPQEFVDNMTEDERRERLIAVLKYLRERVAKDGTLCDGTTDTAEAAGPLALPLPEGTGEPTSGNPLLPEADGVDMVEEDTRDNPSDERTTDNGPYC